MVGGDEKPSLRSHLIERCGQEDAERRGGKVVEEVKKQLWLSGPLITVSLLQFCLQVISVMFVGHLGELALSGSSMATSFASVTGFSLLVSWLILLLLVFLCNIEIYGCGRWVYILNLVGLWDCSAIQFFVICLLFRKCYACWGFYPCCHAYQLT